MLKVCELEAGTYCEDPGTLQMVGKERELQSKTHMNFNQCQLSKVPPYSSLTLGNLFKLLFLIYLPRIMVPSL